MRWTIQDHIRRTGFLHKPEANNYLYTDGTPKEGYSLVPSQQNPNPAYTFSRRNSHKGGGYDTVSLNVYKKDAPAPAPSPAPSPAPAAAPTPPPKPKPVPIKRSEEAATALGRSLAYENTVRKRYGDGLIAGNGSVMDDFNQDTIDNTEEASKPYFDDDVDREEAQKYADKYKLKLGDDLKLQKTV